MRGALQVPVVLRNRYRVLRRLGAGGMGSVYLVEEIRHAEHTGGRLALKALFADPAQEALLSSLRLEFRVLANLRHPLIARVYDFGRLPPDSGLAGSDGRPGFFFTRDLVEGIDLESYCRGLALADICLTLQQAALALDILHRAGMVHGDFKPANVIVSPDGRPHLIDFGLVRSEGQDSMATGTAAYLAPEALRGETVDRRADLYAFGVSLYQLVAGRLPLAGASLGELISWHLDGDPLQLSVVSEVPEELNEVVYRLTQRDPERRYPSAAELAVALAEAAVAAGASAGEVPQPPQVFVPPAPGENLTEPLFALEEAARARTLDQAGGPPLLALEGDPGGGKSTLLQELAWRSQLSGIEVIRGEFRAGDRRAFGLWRDMLSQIASVVGLPHPLEGQPPGDVDRYAVYQRMSSYLSEAAARVPLLLLFDSAEQADPESRDALRFLLHTLNPADPIFVLVAYRPDAELYQALDAPHRIRLQPLAAVDVARMVADASGRQDEELSGRIFAHTGGNPLFVVEVLRRLGEAGWPANPDLERLAPPQRLEEMYAGRFRELVREEKAVLEALAVLGRPARGRVILEVLERKESGAATGPTVGLPLERLEQLEWIDRRPDGAYSFRQGPAAHVVYTQMDADRRRGLHLAAALVLEHSESIDLVERTRHALGAARLDLALPSLDQAIGILKGLGGHRTAIQLLEEVSLLADGDPAHLRRVQRELGDLHHTVGEYDEACRVLVESCAEAPAEELRTSRIALARVHVAAGDAEHALALLDTVLAEDLPARQRLLALSVKTSALTALDAHEAVLAVVQQALALEAESASSGAPSTAVRAELLGQMAWHLGHLQRYDEANAAFETALVDARVAEDPRVEASILNKWAAVACFQKTDFAAVPARYGQALECARRSGDVERLATIRYNLSLYHLWRGEYASCLRHLEESLRLFEAMGAQRSAASARCHLAYLELKLGLFEQARANLARATPQIQRLGPRNAEAVAILLGALAQSARSKFDDAREGIAQARRMYTELGQPHEAADALFDLAEVELAAGQVARALEAVEQAAKEVDLSRTIDLGLRAAALRGQTMARAGTAEERLLAAETLDRVLADTSTVGFPELVWRCHTAAMELADATSRPDLAARHALAACAILEEMGADLPAEAHAAFWQDHRRHAVRERAAAFPRATIRPFSPVPRASGRTGSPANAQEHTLPPEDIPHGLGATLPTVGHPSAPRWAAEQVKLQVEERFYRLLEIYRQVNSELDPERLLGLVMDTAVELTGAERGFLLLGSTPATLKVEVARNLDLEGERGAYSRSIAERVFTTGQPVITVSAKNDPRFCEYLSVHQLQLESVLSIPIHAKGRVAGVLYMESRFQTGRFTPDDQRLLMAFGDQVAIALTNARLLQDNVRKATELERAKREIEALADERGRLLQKRTAQLEEAERDLAETRRKLETRIGMFGMVGRSAPMLRLFELVERVAAAEIPVIIEGESGTGKEMVARAIHSESERRKGRLVSVNCAAIPEGLLESELFGHVRGAFTGADRERKGLFAAAHGGTLFLDEIGDMPARMQVDLLRALQEKTIRPVGGQEDLKVDVRVIAASNKPLAALVQSGRFRQDLFFRLNVVALRLPPLRERGEDIPLLVDHFLSIISAQMKTEKKRITRAAMRRLMDCPWPGNVRQLEHALINAVVLADSETLDAEDLTLEGPAAPLPSAAPPAADAGEGHRAREKRRILEVLESCNWNKSQAAELLGIPRRTFYRRLAAFGIR